MKFDKSKILYKVDKFVVLEEKHDNGQYVCYDVGDGRSFSIPCDELKEAKDFVDAHAKDILK